MHKPSHASLSAIQAHAAAAGRQPADPLRQPLTEARATASAYQEIWNAPLPPTGRIDDVVTATGNRLTLFRPDGIGPSPVLFYFHGGGFVLNSVHGYRRILRLLAQRSGATIAALHYGLAPELRFPGQLHQALDAVEWVLSHAAVLNLQSERWAVAGDSAGANLALAATLARRDAGLALPDLSILFYGMFSARLDTSSHQEYGGGAHGLTTQRVDWFWEQYLPSRTLRTHPLAAPLHADLAGLGRHLVVGAGLDCLLDDSLALARGLKDAGTHVTLTVEEGLPHSFLQANAILPQADASISRAASVMVHALRGTLAQKAA